MPDLRKKGLKQIQPDPFPKPRLRCVPGDMAGLIEGRSPSNSRRWGQGCVPADMAGLIEVGADGTMKRCRLSCVPADVAGLIEGQSCFRMCQKNRVYVSRHVVASGRAAKVSKPRDFQRFGRSPGSSRHAPERWRVGTHKTRKRQATFYVRYCRDTILGKRQRGSLKRAVVEPAVGPDRACRGCGLRGCFAVPLRGGGAQATATEPFGSSYCGTSLMCVAMYQLLPNGSFTPATRSP